SSRSVGAGIAASRVPCPPTSWWTARRGRSSAVRRRSRLCSRLARSASTRSQGSMSASRDILNAIAPEFADEPRADLFLTMAAQRIRPSAFGVLYGQAVAYLAAHMLTMSPDDGGES